MPFCPNCRAAVESGSTRCLSCSADFGPLSHWKPVDDVNQLGAPRKAELANASFAPFVFALLGPPVGAFIFDPRTWAPPWALATMPFMYLVGAVPAAIAGSIFTVVAAVLVVGFKLKRLPIVVAMLVGGCCGLAVDFMVPKQLAVPPFIITGVAGAVMGAISAALRPIGVSKNAG